MTKATRVSYIDNIRILLIALVVLHHLSITYGALGSWYYNEVEGDLFTKMFLTMFTTTNQSFFMALFFLISAYFTKISYDSKKTSSFIKDRLIRLGIPLLVFYFLVCPLTVYTRIKFTSGIDLSFFDFIKAGQGFGFGPMWFVQTLLYFTLIYLLYRKIFNSKTSNKIIQRDFPDGLMILAFALGIAIVSFVVRLWLPLGWEIKYLALQLPYFPQYIAMLILGLMFARYNWFESITYKQGINWFLTAQVFIIIGFPLVFYFGIRESGPEPFMGGWTWQSASLSIWEQITGFALMIGLIGIFKEKLSTQGKLASLLSGAAYTVFILHPLVIVFLAVILKDWDLYPVLKFIVLAPVALISCFGLGIILKQIPIINKVL